MLDNLIFLVVLVIPKNECAKILGVFPTPSISHQVVFRPLMHELARRGHDVTVITTDPAFPKGQCPQNLTEIDVHDVSYNLWNKIITAEKGIENEVQIRVIFNLLAKLVEEQLKSTQVQNLINDKKKTFDLLFVESCVRPAISYSYLYKVPVIEFSSLGPVYGTLHISGAATNPFIYPIATRQRVNNLTLWEKFVEIYSLFNIDRLFLEIEKSHCKMLKEIFGLKMPCIDELKKNVQMIFLNAHPIWDNNRPVPPNVIYLGGLHQNRITELPKDLKSYLDASKNGVIYMSLGTNVKPSLLPKETLKIFTKVFSQLSYDVLLKWDTDEFPDRPNNVNISKWFPQSDLLKHPKVKLFITQGGLQSTDEALTAGVPLIGIPMLGDQWFNVELYVKHNIGIKLGMESLTEDKLRNAIETAINNESYRHNVIKLRNIIHDQSEPSLERAVWWTEYVLRHGSAVHLRSPAAHMHWAEYYAIDVVLSLLGASTVILFITIFIIRLVISKFKSIRIKYKIN